MKGVFRQRTLFDAAVVTLLGVFSAFLMSYFRKFRPIGAASLGVPLILWGVHWVGVISEDKLIGEDDPDS